MGTRKKEFSDWMLKRMKTTGDGTYTADSVSKCTTTLNTVLDKFGIRYNDDENSLFSCGKYSEFIKLDKAIRTHENFGYLDGRNKGRRWIHNGLLLYGYFLLEKEGIDEEDRPDNLESMGSDGRGDGKKV